MKYIPILLTLLVVVGMGCNNERSPAQVKKVKIAKECYTTEGLSDLCVYVVDGCEYVVYQGYNVIHSSSCHNPIHHNYDQKQ